LAISVGLGKLFFSVGLEKLVISVGLEKLQWILFTYWRFKHLGKRRKRGEGWKWNHE
jgi:hypothetical protein